MLSERLPEDQLHEMQFKKFQNLMEYAYQWIPYYKAKFHELGFRPQDLQRLENIKLIPPLSRNDLINHKEQLVDLRYRSALAAADQARGDPGVPIPFAALRKHRLVRNTSSGTTGNPTVFYEDGSRTALNWAYELRLKSWYGIKPGNKEARMVRVATDFKPNSKSLLFRKYFWNQLLLPGMNLSEEDYALCFQKILLFKPKILFGITSALMGLADYVHRIHQDSFPHFLKLIVTWASALYEHEKETLEKTFHCPVTNLYSAREVGHVAALCPYGAFHINQENLYVEHESNGEFHMRDVGGELMITTLDLSPMPLIRYRMGDIGKVIKTTCSCGRTLQELTSLMGRTGEIFISKEGRMIAPNFWCRIFMLGNHADVVKRFQVVYTRDKNIIIRIEKGAGYTPNTEDHLKKTIESSFSSKTQILFQYLDKIEPQTSGKYLLVINEANAANHRSH